MALDAKTAFTAAAQIILEHGAGIRIMAGDAGHGPAIARVDGLFTNRMHKGRMPPMALGTDFIRFIFEHSRIIGTVQGMAIGAVFPVRMFMQHVLPTLEGIGMTIAADAARRTWQEPRTIRRMRRMATGAGVLLTGTQHVVAGVVERIQHIVVALGTDRHTTLLLTVTNPAVPVGKGLVPNLAQQRTFVATVRVMAIQAFHRLRRTAHMRLLQTFPLLVATEAEFGIRLLDQSVIVCGMRIMAGITLPFCEGRVFTCKLVLQVIMAGAAALGEAAAQQVAMISGVRGVASRTFTLAHRIMGDSPGIDTLLQRLVATKAEIFLGLQQEPIVPGGMRAVTALAVSFFQGGMHYSALEIIPIMAIETVCSRYSHSTRAGEGKSRQQDRYQVQTRSDHDLPPG